MSAGRQFDMTKSLNRGLAALILLLSSTAFGQDRGMDLLHKMQKALGGVDKLEAIRDFEETVKAETWNEDGNPLGLVRKRTRWIKPNLLRLDQVGPYDTYVLYFDGTSGWEIMPDRHNPGKTNGVVIGLAGNELDFARGYLYGFFLNQWLADRLPGYSVTSPAPNVVRISVNGESTDIPLDPASMLPAGRSIQAWTRIDGILFPTRRWNYHNNVRMADITTQSLKVNQGLKPEDLSRQPADFSPVMTGR